MDKAILKLFQVYIEHMSKFVDVISSSVFIVKEGTYKYEMEGRQERPLWDGQEMEVSVWTHDY